MTESISTTPTQLDAGTAAEVLVEVVGSEDVYVVRADGLAMKLRPGVKQAFQPEGLVLTARTQSGTSSVITTITPTAPSGAVSVGTMDGKPSLTRATRFQLNGPITVSAGAFAQFIDLTGATATDGADFYADNLLSLGATVVDGYISYPLGEAVYDVHIDVTVEGNVADVDKPISIIGQGGSRTAKIQTALADASALQAGLAFNQVSFDMVDIQYADDSSGGLVLKVGSVGIANALTIDAIDIWVMTRSAGSRP